MLIGCKDELYDVIGGRRRRYNSGCFLVATEEQNYGYQYGNKCHFLIYRIEGEYVVIVLVND